MKELVIRLPEARYDLVASIVLYKTDPHEVDTAISQFLAVPLKSHLCVIDNSPSPALSREWEPHRVTYYFADRNLGYGRAHNIALRAAAGRSPYHLVMNTDIRYSADAVCQLRKFLDDNPQAGLAAPKVCYPDGSTQYVCRLLPTPVNLFLRRFLPNSPLTRRADESYELRFWDHECVANLPYFQGSFMLLRTDLTNSLGGFDERFFLYGEDIDLTRRIHAVAETLFVPHIHITHEYRRYSNTSMLGTWYGIQNNIRYFNKWGWIRDEERQHINRNVISRLRQHALHADGPQALDGCS